MGNEYILLGTTSRGTILYMCIVQVGDEYVVLGTTSRGTILYRCIVQVGDEYVLLGTTSHETILYRGRMSMYCSVQLAVELYCTCVLYRW